MVDLDDGAGPQLFPEHVAVQAGLVPPTPEMYAGGGINGMGTIVNQPQQYAGGGVNGLGQIVNQQYAGSAEAAAPIENVYETQMPQLAEPQFAPQQPVGGPAPAPMAPGTSARSGYSVSQSTPGYISREKAFGPAPAPLDLSQQRADLAANQAEYADATAEQGAAMQDKAYAEQRADETLYGKFSPDGTLLHSGGAQALNQARAEDVEARAAFDGIVAEYVQKETARINERIARVPQEDPNRIWHENSAFQNAAGLGAAFLGGMLAVSTGSGRNLGLEAMERAIERDIQAQRTNIENEWKKVTLDKDSLQQYQQWKSQERGRMLEEAAVRYESIATEYDAKATTFKSQARQAEYMGLAAQARAKSAEKAQEAIRFSAEFAKAESDSELNRWKALGDAAVQRSQIAENRAQAALASASAKSKAPDVNPPIYQFKNGDTMYLDPRYASTMRPEDIEKYRQTAAKKDTFIQSYDELIRDVGVMGRKLAVAPGKVGVGSPELKALKDRAMKFALDYTNEKAATTFTDRLLDTVVSMSGSPQGLTDVDKVPSMLEFKKSIIGEFDGQFRGRGAFIVGGKPGPDGQPAVSSFDAYGQYGADPRPADPGPPGQRLQGALTDIMFGTDPQSQLQSLDSVLNYVAAPVGGGAGAAGLRGMLQNLTVVEADGKKGLSNRGGAALPKEQAIKRITLQRTRLKAHAEDQVTRDRIDDMFDELESYLRQDPTTYDTKAEAEASKYLDREFRRRPGRE